MVQSHLEYYVQFWPLYLRKHTTEKGKVQKKGTKMIKGLQHLSYEELIILEKR